MTAIVKVFLASPGGLGDERQTVRARAEHFNRTWSDEFGIHYRVIGWEDTPAVSMRPQQRINRDANDCELFIGILWTRWGSETGTHSSGFEEEFLLAQERRRAGESPEVALFFKRIDPNLLADPGAQLTKVLEFKRGIVDAREYLYKEFAEPSDLADQVDQVLAEYAKLAARRLRDPGGVATAAENPKQAHTTAIDTEDIGAVFDAARAAVGGESNRALDTWAGLRLLLYSTAAYAESFNHVTFGHHEANRVFVKRKAWRLNRLEHLLLTRSMLRDTYRYTPGWFWLADHGVEVVRERLWYLCLVDDDAKKAAATLLALDVVLPTEKSMVLDALVDTVTGPIICPLVGRVGATEYIEVLQEAKTTSPILDKLPFWEAEFEILLRADVSIDTDALNPYVEAGVSKAVNVLAVRLAQEDDTVLLRLLNGKPDEERLRIVKALRSHSLFRASTAEAMLADSSEKVREVAVWTLIDGGRTFHRAQLSEMFAREPGESMGLLGRALNWVDVGAMVKACLRARSKEELAAEIDFFGFDAVAALEVIGELHWDDFASEIERQLDTDFEALLTTSETQHMALTGVSYRAAWEKPDVNLVSSRRSDLIEAGLAAVLSHGHPKAIEWANKYLQGAYEESIRLLALRVFGKYERVPDYSARVAEMIKLPNSLVVELLPVVIARLGVNANLIETIAGLKSDPVRETLEGLLASSWRADDASGVEPLLLSKVSEARLVAASLLARKLSHSECEALLDRYIGGETYYYDVVSIFDRALYGVDPYEPVQ